VKRTVIGILLAPIGLLAQQSGTAWTNIGPSPDAVQAIAVDPHDAQTIFLGGDASGVRKSIDSGTTWSTINTGLTNLSVQTIAFDASGPSTIYAGTAGGLFKSNDAGVTWQNLTTGSVTVVAADPNKPGVLYASIFNNLANGSIRKSIDGGATWTTILPTTAAIFNITIDPTNQDILYAPTVGHGAFKSTDGGQHWVSMSDLTPQTIWKIALDPTNSQVLYAGTNQDGIWKSTDAGYNWQFAGSPGSFPVNSLIVDPSGAPTIYAGTNGGGVWTSSDGGVSWQSTGISNGMVWSLALDSAGALYAGTNAVGAQVSRDRGATWTVLQTGIDGANKFAYGVWIDPGNGRKILVSSELGYGAVWSQDGGASWSIAGQGLTAYGSRGIAFDPSDSRLIYAGGMVGDPLFKSTDGGQTWSVRRFGTPAIYVIAVAVDPLSPNTIYAGTQNEGVFKSTDHGDTWTAVGTGLSGAITFLTLDPSKNGRLFASTATAFYLSEDGGQSWTNIMNVPAWTVAIDPNSPVTVYASTRTQGVFRSSDGGHTWQSINNGITNLSMGRNAPVIIDPTSRQTLYVGSDGGVFKSLDGGDHWFAVNSGLADLSVTGLAMDPHNPAVLYASGPSGVFKTVTAAEVLSTPVISAVLNGASYQSGLVRPGEIVVITGSGLAPAQLIKGTPANGVYNTQLSGVSVHFNGISAPLIYTSSTYIAALVPDGVFYYPAVNVTITYEGRTSAAYRMVAPDLFAPGVFTLDATGHGQAVALNQDGSINTASHPAKAGDLISLYVTGLLPFDPVFVIIGTDSITASTRNLIPGVLQVDARIPAGVQTGSAVPVFVLWGTPTLDTDNPSQPGVTIAVQGTSQIATDTSIDWATAVTTDATGNVYFISSNSVFRVDPQGFLTRIAGKGLPGYSGDGGPAVDAQLFTDDLINETPNFGMPSGLALDSKGNLYVSDGGNARIRRISPDGIITTVAGNGTHGSSGDGEPGASGQIASPRGLAIDGSDNLYIADTHSVRKLSAGGTIGTAAPFGGVGVAVDSGGNLYVVDYHSVRKVSRLDGSITTVAGGTGIIGDGGDGGPATSAAFVAPTTVAVDRAGSLYIGDTYRVRKVSPDGIINIVAGGGKNDPGDGGPATSAQITVQSIALDASANLYIAGSGRVRKVSSDGTITTVAGNGK
jgi:uncharacterized protein (TIGR03437 family)